MDHVLTSRKMSFDTISFLFTKGPDDLATFEGRVVHFNAHTNRNSYLATGISKDNSYKITELTMTVNILKLSDLQSNSSHNVNGKQLCIIDDSIFC